ncbi:MAG: dihydrolipoyllysine-residue acetyltransferase [Chromatiales bacterium]
MTQQIAAMGEERLFVLPDIGSFKDVPIIEVLVKTGDRVKAEDPLITLESDKATMEIPAPYAGVVKEMKVAVGDKVSEGTPICVIEEAAEVAAAARVDAARPQPPPPPAMPSALTVPAPAEPAAARPPPAVPRGAQTVGGSASAKAHASPSTRIFARELGVDLGLVTGSGPKGRILKGDVKAFVKGAVSGTTIASSGRFALPEIPPIDFSKFGPVESVPLSRIRRLAGQNLQRSWIAVPHVTQFDEADITDLEEFRNSKLAAAKDKGVKLTLVSFLLKAVVTALAKYPQFCASLSADGESLVYKKYVHIGVAVNTEEGLVVPVVRDVDQKGLFDLAREVQILSSKARQRKLGPAEMQGGCFTISSLGGVGGSSFTPIINVPEVAILGVSPARMRPVYQDGEFVPRLMLPFALSYDHRVIDGVAGAQFTQYLSAVLSDIRQILL